ncbi:MAG: NAD(P)-dependent oxidoreductase [Geminicoccaceae bacterium]|nr:NAD(P)-dependent oxidoreductase [Geminicoccaceae bacterium]
MRVLLTGASSFTGMWLVLALAKRGVEVVAALRGDPRRYDAVRQARMTQVAAHAAVLPEAPMGSQALYDAADRLGPFEGLVLHGAHVGDFKDPAYDAGRAVVANTAGLERLVVRLKANGLKRIVATGSVFEAGEGRGDGPLHHVGAYGFAKSMTWEILKETADREAVDLAKFVIASPFGAYEKPGFVQELMRRWLAGETAYVRTPQVGRDWVPAPALAEAHADMVAAAPPYPPLARLTPSFLPLTNGAFAAFLAREARSRLGRPCALRLADPPEPPDGPLERYGVDRLPDGDGQVLRDVLDGLVGWHQRLAERKQGYSLIS